MSGVIIAGDTSGSVTLQAPAVAGTTTLTLPATSGTLALTANVGDYYGFKNRIINGAMVIDQRNAGAVVNTINGVSYITDRWIVEEGTATGVLSAQQVSDAPAGFVNSLKVTASTGTGAIGAGEFSVITQIIEGFNTADFAWGSSSATPVVVSFWVKATTTGTYSCTIYNNGASRINPQPYTINVANTWEYKTVAFVGDTTGTWLTNNGRGFIVNFYTGLGTSYQSTAGWNGSSKYGVTGTTNAFVTAGNTFQITGVQLEKGTTATSFDYRPFGTELALCQRYFQKVGDGGNPYAVLGVGRFSSTTNASIRFSWSVPMRTTPSGSFNTGTYQFTDGTSSRSVGAISFYSAGTDGVEGDIVTSAATNGAMTQLRGNAASPNAPYINLSAEL